MEDSVPPTMESLLCACCLIGADMYALPLPDVRRITTILLELARVLHQTVYKLFLPLRWSLRFSQKKQCTSVTDEHHIVRRMLLIHVWYLQITHIIWFAGCKGVVMTEWALYVQLTQNVMPVGNPHNSTTTKVIRVSDYASWRIVPSSGSSTLLGILYTRELCLEVTWRMMMRCMWQHLTTVIHL